MYLYFRAMDFLVEIFRNLLEHPDWSMSKVCTDSYSTTLKKWHGWLASSSFTVTDVVFPRKNDTLNFHVGASVGLDDMKAS
ncbi:hypothetical protein BHE74_00016717 [Ensete ventricosum]|nr:hypothetical protein BHE74_00016717 [Ensete ventricosum]